VVGPREQVVGRYGHPRSRPSHSRGAGDLKCSADRRILTDARRLLCRQRVQVRRRSRRLVGQPGRDQVLWRRRSGVASRGGRRAEAEEGGVMGSRARATLCWRGRKTTFFKAVFTVLAIPSHQQYRVFLRVNENRCNGLQLPSRLLESQHCSRKQVFSAGFTFRFPSWMSRVRVPSPALTLRFSWHGTPSRKLLSPVVPGPSRLVSAVPPGVPARTGVALGFDGLVMGGPGPSLLSPHRFRWRLTRAPEGRKRRPAYADENGD
jgi:hypothetical protein